MIFEMKTVPVVRNIREMLKIRGLRHKDLARKLSVHPVHLSRILNSHSGMSVEMVQRCAKILGIAPHKLLYPRDQFDEEFEAEVRSTA